MSQRNWIILAVVALFSAGIGGVAGVLIYNQVVGGDDTPSEAISAPTLDVNAVPTQSANQLSTQIAELQAQNVTLQAAVAEAGNAQSADTGVMDDMGTLTADNATLQAQVAGMSEATSEAQAVPAEPTAATIEPTAVPAEAATTAPEASADARSLFRIVSEDSEVRFLIDEELFGDPVQVVGRTNQVAGDIVVDFTNPALSQVGTIRINMRTLATDNEFRNNALRARILQSSQDEYEFSDFVPTEITGLPASVTSGQAFTFQLTGDLTVRGVTRSVTFEVTLTPVSETRLEGLAVAQVLYTDFNLSIPNAPGVANISEEVGLEIQFLAELVEGS